MSLVLHSVKIVRSGRLLLEVPMLSLAPACVTVVVGPNGSGKSTLLRAMAGQGPGLSGRVMLGGRDLRAMRPLDQASRRALLGQEPRAAIPFTLEDVVGLGLFARGLSLKSEQARAQIAAALEQVGLTHLAQRRITEVSGGEARRTHLARVMVQVWEAENCLLLLDEPTTGLDLVHLEALERAMAGFAARGGTVVIAAHDLGWARRAGQQAIIVANGRIGGQGPVADLLTPATLAPVYQVATASVARALAVG